ncbi:hypothetical protein SAMN05421812_11594 [Asanoa hainanensis]|uniref:Uncharacterized protein n=1 Tax=Asanoa hainanensis TaxID=560556 RepID=A0A239PA28_9ACTN|nr:hypothetical protein [Asanoa hainanensis]SNT63428.1 hypothetical protein SAMN05421812_11594 [Asanoa hainanensis]
MTNPHRTTVRVATVTAAVVLGGFTLGCGLVQNAVDTANTLGEFSDRLGRSAELTYTATYQTDDATVTFVQQPPNSAVLSANSRLISTPTAMIMCDRSECQQAPNTAAVAGPADANLVSAVGGAGFLTPELALGLVAAAAIVPGTDVSTSEREIAGQDSLCADVDGIEDPEAGAQPGDMKSFSVCVTETGLLSSFSGETHSGDRTRIELVSYSDKVDPAAFAPPKGAKVVDVTDLAAQAIGN